MKVGGATDGELILTEVAQDQVWLDPDVEQTEVRYPGFSKKGEHSKYANITFRVSAQYFFSISILMFDNFDTYSY